MDWILLAVFLIGTTYLPGGALRCLLPAIHPATQVAFGLSLSLILCALPEPIAAWALPLMALSSAAVLVSSSRRSDGAGRVRSSLFLPGLTLGVLCLSLGPWRDASTLGEGDFVYRTGHTVGSRSAGPRPVLAEAALVHARSANMGDPFVSGHPLAAIDPRRTYWSLAERFSGASPHFLIGKAEPGLLLCGVLWVALFALPRTSWLFGALLFGSGFSFLFALLPAIESWQFRIWAYLSESTGLPDLLTEPTTPLFLFLSLAAATCRARAPVFLPGIALLACEPAMALPLALALLLFTWRAPVGVPAKISLLAAVLIGMALSHRTPFAPLLRALEYGRLEYLADGVAHPLASAANALRTAASAVAFLFVSLGLGAFALPRVLRDVAIPERANNRGLACLVLALLFCGFMGIGAGSAWSLGLLLLSAPLAGVISESVSALSRGRRLFALAASAILVYPASINYLLHYRSSVVERLNSTDVELALTLREKSLSGDPVLHRPNRSTLSLASHVSFRPAVLCYYGRSGSYDLRDLAERSNTVRRFYETTDQASALESVRRYGARFVIVDKDRPLRFSEPRWLQRVGESETAILYEVK